MLLGFQVAESPNRSNAAMMDKSAISPSPLPEGEEITNKDIEEQVSTCHMECWESGEKELHLFSKL